MFLGWGLVGVVREGGRGTDYFDECSTFFFFLRCSHFACLDRRLLVLSLAHSVLLSFIFFWLSLFPSFLLSFSLYVFISFLFFLFSQEVEGQPFNEWCRVHSTGGALSFQEMSSMVPPLLASIDPSHAVLDLCAAPGSKSSQVR